MALQPMTELTLEALRSELTAALEPIRSELASVRAEIETIKVQISGLPLTAATLHELREDVRELRRETQLVKAAVNDMARVNITAGEVEALHDELDHIASEHAEIKARLELLERKP
jgi:prefoldin subunit 5